LPFDRVLGQAPAIATLQRALRNGLVHHAYRFEGPAGVGKELAAMAFAQALVCEAGDSLGCGSCDSCRRAVQLSQAEPCVPLHPDVVLVERALYPPELIGGKKEAAEISVEQIRRVVLARAAYPPHEGRARVFIVRRAEELSISAANALLKTLEEPRAATYFVLLSAQPERLVETIRSRSVPVRFGPLADGVLTTILRAQGIAEERVATIVQLAGGSASVALESADAETTGAADSFATRVIEAMRAPHLASAVMLGESLNRDRHQLVDSLRTLGAHFVEEARARARGAPRRAEVAARRYGLVLDAINAVQRNGAAGLCVSTLVASLRHAYQRRPGTPPVAVITRR